VRDAIQVPIEAALKLRKKTDVGEVESLRVDTYAAHFAEQVKDKALWTPTTRESADHSMPFCVGAALLDGEVTSETFEQSRFLDKDARAMVKRITVEFDDAFEKVAPATRTCRITATLKNGKTVTAMHKQTPADIARGPSDDAFAEKFHRLASRSMETAERNKLLDIIWGLDKLKHIHPIVDLTAI
jgi:2-methylcitrate dehydratase